MNKISVQKIFVSVAFFFCISVLHAEKTPVENLYQYRLENGLSLFVAENHSVPLAYVEIAVRAGAVVQTPQNAGLFHLYEHMMFKGNKLYGDAASVNRALSNLGVANWNGSTGVNHVNYYFTIPSDRLDEGLAFWNAAIRSPNLDEKELQNEKKVVLNEIAGGKAEPSSVFYKYLMSQLFPDAPYRIDSGGSFDVVQNATVDELQEIRGEFYVPSNAALFVGGDVCADEVFALAEKIFGTWKNPESPAEKKLTQQNQFPFSEPKFAVMGHEKISRDYASMEIQFRGADAEFDLADTYALDYLMNLLNEPGGIFRRTLFRDKTLSIPDEDDSWAQYATVRANGLIEFGATVTSTQNDIASRPQKFLEQIQQKILPKILSQKKLFSDSYKKKMIEKLKDSQTLETETAADVLKSVRFWWVNASAENFYDYFDELEKVTQDDVIRVAKKYILNGAPMVSVLVNPEILDEEKNNFAQKNFYFVTTEEEPWWQNEKFRGKKSAQKKSYEFSDEEIYSPQKNNPAEKNGSEKKIQRSVEIRTLKNGIPVFFNFTDSEIISAAVVCKGGVENLSVENSGMETTLFWFMTNSSKKFPRNSRIKISYDTNASFDYFSRLSGSALYLQTLEKFFDGTFDVFMDGFLQPSFSADDFKNKKTQLAQSIQSRMNDAQSLLSYAISDSVFKNHPYEAKSFVTAESFDNITVENLKAHHKKILDASKIFVVVSGKIDAEKVTAKLESTLGKLKSSAQKFQPSEIPDVKIQQDEPVILTLPSAKGTAYISRVFSAPKNSDEDFAPCMLASEILSDVMFNVIRERNGICYSVQSYVSGSRASIGVEHLYKVSDFENFARAMEESRSYLAKGKIVEGLAADGSYKFSSLAENLDGYKNSYVTQNFQGQSTNAGQIVTLSYNILQFDDMNFDLVQLERVKNSSADDILRVFKKYWLDGNSAWFAVTGEDEKSKLNFGQ